jgi:hypothetical protein
MPLRKTPPPEFNTTDRPLLSPGQTAHATLPKSNGALAPQESPAH